MGVAVPDRNVVAAWDDAHRYSPAPRHRRRLILKLLRTLSFETCLDAGCAQPFLLARIARQFGARGFGCDLSDQVIAANRERFPDMEFCVVDLTAERWPAGRQFDLVICSEVLEHIPQWPSALANILRMTRHHLLLTVPSGPIRAMDRKVGHLQHFQGPELRQALEEHGCEILRLFHWGFPVHSLYKRLISGVSPDRLYAQFAEGRYGSMKKLLSQALYAAFFLNQFNCGDQLFVLARPRGAGVDG